MIFFIQLCHLVTKCQRINKNFEDRRFLFICRRFVTKQLSWIKKIINIHYQWSLPDSADPMPSATILKINFQISDFSPTLQGNPKGKKIHVKVKTTHVADVGSIILGPVDSIILCHSSVVAVVVFRGRSCHLLVKKQKTGSC